MEEEKEEEDEKKYFIWLCGLTGSGKTSLCDKTIARLGIHPAEVVKIGIDDLVEPDADYKTQVRNILRSQTYIPPPAEDSGTSSQNENYCKYNPNIVADMFGAYNSVRDGKVTELNENVRNALENKKHIAYETTFKTFPHWIFKDTSIGFDAVKSNYQFVFSFSLVNDMKKLSDRNINRYETACKEFLRDESSNAPRIPNVNELRNNWKILKTNKDKLISLKKVCLTTADDDCVFKDARIIVFDNGKGESESSGEGGLLFDSNNRSRSTTGLGGGGVRRRSARRQRPLTTKIRRIKKKRWKMTKRRTRRRPEL